MTNKDLINMHKIMGMFTLPVKKPVIETQYHNQGDLYYCPACDHVLTIRDGSITDSSCKHPYIDYMPVSDDTFIEMIMDRPHVLRDGYKHED